MVERICPTTTKVQSMIDAFAGGASLTVSETEVFSGTSPKSWSDLNLSGAVGAQATLVMLKWMGTDNVNDVFFRKNGDTDEFYTSDVTNRAGHGVAGGNPVLSIQCVVMVVTDPSGIIEWRSSYNRINTTVDVMAYIK